MWRNTTLCNSNHKERIKKSSSFIPYLLLCTRDWINCKNWKKHFFLKLHRALVATIVNKHFSEKMLPKNFKCFTLLKFTACKILNTVLYSYLWLTKKNKMSIKTLLVSINKIKRPTLVGRSNFRWSKHFDHMIDGRSDDRNVFF